MQSRKEHPPQSEDLLVRTFLLDSRLAFRMRLASTTTSVMTFTILNQKSLTNEVYQDHVHNMLMNLSHPGIDLLFFDIGTSC